jgi:hypothetical protein
MLLKVPNVRYLDYFTSVFPYETLLLLIRDGRDVVNSTLKTWPYKKFSDVCREWDYSAKMIFCFDEHYCNKKNDYLLAKYEDILENPVNFAKMACDRYGLDYQKFPVEKIDELKVVGSSSIQSQGKVTWQAAEKPQDFQSTQRWLKWSSEEKQIFKEIAGQTLIDAGYEKDLDW